MEFWDASGITWTICKQSAPHFRQITTPTPYHSIFTGWMLFLMPSQQCKSTEGQCYGKMVVDISSVIGCNFHCVDSKLNTVHCLHAP